MSKVIELLKKSGVDTGGGRWVYDEFEVNLDQLDEFYTLARADLEAEVAALKEELLEQASRANIGTHGPGCETWGPRHYECLLAKHEKVRKALSKLITATSHLGVCPGTLDDARKALLPNAETDALPVNANKPPQVGLD